MNLPFQKDNLISEADRQALYKTIFSRRDVRGQFKPDPIPDSIISRILYAAHHAPSVGFMQPWNFIIIKSKSVREKVHDALKKFMMLLNALIVKLPACSPSGNVKSTVP